MGNLPFENWNLFAGLNCGNLTSDTHPLLDGRYCIAMFVTRKTRCLYNQSGTLSEALEKKLYGLEALGFNMPEAAGSWIETFRNSRCFMNRYTY